MTEPEAAQDDNTRILNEMISAVTPDIPADQLSLRVDDALRDWAANNDDSTPRHKSPMREIGGAIATMTSGGMTADQASRNLDESLRNLGDDE